MAEKSLRELEEDYKRMVRFNDNMWYWYVGTWLVLIAGGALIQALT